MTSSRHFPSIEAGHIDPQETRRLIEAAKQSGLVRDQHTTVPISRNGAEAVTAPPASIAPAAPAKPSDAPAGVHCQWIDVDPGLAAHWLQNNFRNRPVAEDVVAAYARDMVNGEWVSTHQGIAFNDRDELIDGQHRLLAIIRSGITVSMLVTFGLKSDIKGKEVTTMDAVDRGRTRSVADQLKIQHGLKNGSKIAGICQTIAALCFRARTRRLSVGQTLTIYRMFQDEVDWTIRFASRSPGLRAKGVAAACTFAIAADPKLKDICHRIYTGEGIEPATPIHQLRAFLVSDEAKLLNRGTDRALSELVLHAIHLHIAGETVERLELAETGRLAFSALQPDRVKQVAAIFQLPS